MIIDDIYKISDKYNAIMCGKNGCSTIALQTISYNEKTDINIYKKALYNHINCINQGNMFKKSRQHKRQYSAIDKHYEKLIFIFRDPVDRFVSAYFTMNRFTKNKYSDINDFCKFTRRELCKGHNCDPHVKLQSKCAKNLNRIDIFINLKDYEQFCLQEQIPYLKANQHPDKNTKENFIITPELIMFIQDVYQEDYRMIHLIKESGKLFMP